MVWQDHFEESQFEEIARSPAGGRKLKPNAIPTLFNVPDPPSPVTPQMVLPVKNEPGKLIEAFFIFLDFCRKCFD